ncbi:AAA family ATPase [Kibdelosporangium philippinense]|uniref:AAA family ATPase n=1 Tax=Kibdelosporangium philippinense TaxID=211113 RepID=A0ABS8ZIL2_9PSEU|nr:AAA family ATPase [Kibdelosporangium philippinense]MCE7006943.1 AAA family ATPase [Kibdelosporangium philippinense]
MSVSLERPITIGVLGTHSTGKSTFVARLAHELRLQDIDVATVTGLGEQAQRLGLPIAFNHTFTSTLWIITRGISNELEAWLHADVVLVDRAVPDALGYYRAALAYRNEEPDIAAVADLESLVKAHSRHYDLMLCTTLDPSTAPGGYKIRDSHSDFRVLADHYVSRVLHEMRLPHELLPADGHDQALARALAFATARLSGLHTGRSRDGPASGAPPGERLPTPPPKE